MGTGGAGRNQTNNWQTRKPSRRLTVGCHLSEGTGAPAPDGAGFGPHLALQKNKNLVSENRRKNEKRPDHLKRLFTIVLFDAQALCVFYLATGEG